MKISLYCFSVSGLLSEFVLVHSCSHEPVPLLMCVPDKRIPHISDSVWPR